MTVNSINLAQQLVTPNKANAKNVAFRGTTPDLDQLKAKQDEFQRMSEQMGDNGVMGKLGKFATKAIGVVIAFTATKICLDKAANMIGGAIGKYADSAAQKATEKLTEKAAQKTGEEAAKLTAQAQAITDKLTKSKELGEKIQKYAVNIVAGGAAIGTAMKDFGLVKKQVSSTSENLVDNALDKANGGSYNSYNSNSGSSDFDIKDDEF